MNLNEKMRNLQKELKAPKSQDNTFGNYKYRSLEDILEALKPLFVQYELSVHFTDELVQIGERYYIKATATITDGTSEHSSQAFAREPLVQKGMNESQITCSASSFARKYAVSGLLAIDDTKEGGEENKRTPAKITPQGKAKAIVEQAFLEFTTKHKDEFLVGFEWNKEKFITAIIKHWHKLPTSKESIKLILETIKPEDAMVEIKPEAA